MPVTSSSGGRGRKMAAGSSYREFSDDNLLIPPLGKKNNTQIGMARTASPLWPTVLSRRALGEEGLPFSQRNVHLALETLFPVSSYPDAPFLGPCFLTAGAPHLVTLIVPPHRDQLGWLPGNQSDCLSWEPDLRSQPRCLPHRLTGTVLGDS